MELGVELELDNSLRMSFWSQYVLGRAGVWPKAS